MRLVVLAIALSFATGCARSSSPVTIGTAGPWNASYGQMNKRGIDLAVEEINAKGGIAGRPLRLVSRNDDGDGAKAAAIAGEFLANPEIVAVVGHVTSGAMVAAARVYDEGLPAVATTASTPDLSGASRFVFRVISSDSANGIALARFVRRRGIHRAAILFENTAYGRGLTDAFSRAFDGEIVSADPIPSADSADFEPWIAYLLSRRPELVFVAGTDASGRAILREARRRKLQATFIGGDGWAGIASDPAIAEGAFVGAPFTPEDARPEAQRFVRSFRQRYQMAPDGNAALAYDATMLVARAIEQAGPRRSAIRGWVASLGAEHPFAGVTGPIRFLPSGDVAGKGIVVTQVRDGALLPVADAGQP